MLALLAPAEFVQTLKNISALPPVRPRSENPIFRKRRGEMNVSMPPAPPPPAEWRSRPLADWRGRDWSAAWRDAQEETRQDAVNFNRVRLWAELLAGLPRGYWADGAVPERQGVGGERGAGRSEMLTCAGKPNLHTPLHASQPACESWWPPADDCTVYVVGVGDLAKGGRGDPWGFPKHAARSTFHGSSPLLEAAAAWTSGPMIT